MFKNVCVLLLVFLSVLSTAGISLAESQREITVSAAISLKDAFEEIGKLYEGRNKGTKVVFNFGASGDLIRQIEAGAPVDVFASASLKDMDEADIKGLIISDSRVNFAGNVMVLVVPKYSKLNIRSFNDLRRHDVKKIAIGNPKTVPAGRYSEEVLRYFRLWDVIRDKLVFAENVRQVLDYVARNEVDAGLLYHTDALIRAEDVKIVVKASEESHKAVIYPIAVVKGTKHEKLSKGFIFAVCSNEGKRILKKYGFRVFNK